ncbi:MAG: AAA family ATPase [Methylococcales bacterium]|nr:AAA family ATPase [Methylococcales bacterium]
MGAELPQGRLLKTLLSQPRVTQLNLAWHVLTTQQQPVVISGPVGIGKTTFLQTLANLPDLPAQCCLLEADHQDRLEALQGRLLRVLEKRAGDQPFPGLTAYFEQLARQQQNIIVLIDNAGVFRPGLIDALNLWASEFASLRLVYAMSQDDAALKLHTDPNLEACRFIDIPPLSAREIRDFLIAQSALPNIPVSFQDIDDDLVRQLFEDSSGVPGRISLLFPALNQTPKQQLNTLYVLTLVVLILVLVTYLVFHVGSQQLHQPEAQAPTVLSSSPVVVAESESKPVQAPPPASKVQEQPAALSEPVVAPPPASKVQEQPAALSEPVVAPAATDNTKAELSEPLATPVAEPVVAKPADAAEQWLQHLPDNHYTVQLMVLTYPGADWQLRERYPELKNALYQLKSRSAEQYYIVYGDFADYEQAKAKVVTLPDKLKNAWVRNSARLKTDLGWR